MILAVLDAGQLWVANTGDSRGVFGNRWQGTSALFLFLHSFTRNVQNLKFLEMINKTKKNNNSTIIFRIDN